MLCSNNCFKDEAMGDAEDEATSRNTLANLMMTSIILGVVTICLSAILTTQYQQEYMNAKSSPDTAAIAPLLKAACAG